MPVVLKLKTLPNNSLLEKPLLIRVILCQRQGLLFPTHPLKKATVKDIKECARSLRGFPITFCLLQILLANDFEREFMALFLVIVVRYTYIKRSWPRVFQKLQKIGIILYPPRFSLVLATLLSIRKKAKKIFSVFYGLAKVSKVCPV